MMIWIVKILFAVICLCFVGMLYGEIRSRIRLNAVRKRIKAFLPDVVFILDKPLRIIDANQYNNALFPFLREEIINANLWDVFPADFLVKIYKGYKDVLCANKIITVSSSLLYNGKHILLKNRFVPLRHKYVLCIITEDKGM